MSFETMEENTLCYSIMVRNGLSQTATGVYTMFPQRPFQMKTFTERNMNLHITSVLRPSRILVRNLCSTATSKSELPRLPVPPLQDTLKKYLKSVKPFLNQNELEVTENKVKEFGAPGGVGERLQCLLEQKAKSTQNWLAEWWLNVAYLGFRSPVVFYSSPGLVFPKQTFECLDDQLEYSAKIISAALDYKFLIDRNKIPQETMGKHPLDMSQYLKVFGTCRIPSIPRDELIFNRDSKHIIVICKNNFFKMDVITDEGEVLSYSQILKNLKTIVDESKAHAPPVGILTSEHRDTWAHAYKELIKDSKNEQNLCIVANSLFTLSLDTCCYNSSELVTSKRDPMTAAGYQTIIGGGPDYNGGNRWFDKTIQFVVDNKGHNGLTYEHSPAEGQPIAIMTDHIMKYISSDKTAEGVESETCSPEKLEFVISDKVCRAIENAENNLHVLLKDIDLECFKFSTYGKEFIKSQKLSPDSFIQMAIQYAFYRIHKVPGAHYESAATRMFNLGRTETIRSCSVESIEFCKTMLNPSASNVEKQKALKIAITAHKDYTNQALQGLGVDRHLLGLKLIASENDIPLPDLYSDVSFTRSSSMRISTSQVAAKCDGFMVYGPILKDGYACCYNPRPNDINFGTSTFKSCRETSALKWKEAIIQSLIDMKCILEEAPQAKL